MTSNYNYLKLYFYNDLFSLFTSFIMSIRDLDKHTPKEVR